MNYRYVRIASFYPTMFADFIGKNPTWQQFSYAEAQTRFFHEGYGLGNAYERELALLGNDTHTIIPTFDALQDKWKAENGVHGRTRFATVLAQLAQLQPEVLFIEDVFFFSSVELAQIRARLSSLRVVYGFLGSDYTDDTLERLRQYDFVVTCSSELADAFRGAGITTHTILHAFDPMVLERTALAPPEERIDISFLGGLTSGEQFHTGRNELLHHLVANGVDIALFSNVSQGTVHLRIPIRMVARTADLVSRFGYFAAFEDMMLIRRIRGWIPRESMRMEPAFRTRIRPAVFGLDMYRALQRSLVTFNSHVTTSRIARNMRLFEATGVGACLITDWRENMNDVFEDGTEAVTYRSKEECLDKIRWLVAHPEETRQIAAAGQRRCLRDHTYRSRATQLDEVITRQFARA